MNGTHLCLLPLAPLHQHHHLLGSDLFSGFLRVPPPRSGEPPGANGTRQGEHPLVRGPFCAHHFVVGGRDSLGCTELLQDPNGFWGHDSGCWVGSVGGRDSFVRRLERNKIIMNISVTF